MTPITGSLEVAMNTLWPQNHGDLCGRFDLVYDNKRSQGHRGCHDLLYDPKGHGDLCGILPSLWPQKVMGSLEVAVTYFITPKVTVFVVVAPKGHRVIRGRRDLLKGHGDFVVGLT